MYENEIERGSKLLDKHFGTDWIYRVNVQTLKLSDCKRCVLGQLSDHFEDGKDVLKIYWPTTAACGFIVIDADDAYDTLTSEWREFILARRRVREEALTEAVTA